MFMSVIRWRLVSRIGKLACRGPTEERRVRTSKYQDYFQGPLIA